MTTNNNMQQNSSETLCLVDTTIYGYRKDDFITDTTEKSAVTHHKLTIGEKVIEYTARAGHLVVADQYSSQPQAKLFFVSFTRDGVKPVEQPVTFFYNGGPGSSAVFLLLGSFGPRRILTQMPYFTPPPPYSLENNADSLLDQSDLVFINPVGTGYSAAIAPKTNGDFWGVDQDAQSIKQFIKRYLTVFSRWNSPKFLFGESYGTPRTCVLTWLLHEDGIDLNGVILQSSVLDLSAPNGNAGVLPTFAADALYHDMVKLSPLPTDLPTFMKKAQEFARGPFASAKATFPNSDPKIIKTLSEMIGIPPEELKHWKLDLTSGNGTTFLTSLLKVKGYAIGAYDGRVKANNTGIAASVSPNAGGNDPTITAVGGVYSAMWNVYLNQELEFTATSPFMDLNDQAFSNWDWKHTDPTGAEKGGIAGLYTAGDLAASMELNPYLKVFCANGYFDSVTPFFQTIMDLEGMPLGNQESRQNLTIRNYKSGHMIYLDNEARTAMRADLNAFYKDERTQPVVLDVKAMEVKRFISTSRYRRRFGETPY